MQSALPQTRSDASGPRVQGLYPRVLGKAWDDLPRSVQRFHYAEGSIQATGVFRVRHGTNHFARWATWLAGLPAEGDKVAIRLAVVAVGDSETWSRIFAKRPMISYQRHHSAGLLAEALGPLEIRFRLEVIEGALVYHHAGTSLCVGPWRIPLPRWLAPQVSAWEKATGDPRQVEVSIEATSSLLGPLVAYGGLVTLSEELS